MRSAVHGLPGRLGLAALSLALAFAVAELAVRRSPALADAGWSAPPLYQAEPTLGWALRPSLDVVWRDARFDGGAVAVRTDALGRRVHAARHDAPGDTSVRVLLLGDSFAFGWGVEAEHALAGRLAASTVGDRSLEVANTGVPGYGPRQYRRVLAQALDRAPFHIVLLLLTENDIADLAGDLDPMRVVEGRLARAVSAPDALERPGWFLRTLLTRSAVARLTHRVVVARDGGPRDATRLPAYALQTLRVPRPPRVVAAGRELSEILGDMAEIASSAGSAFAVAAAPRSFEVYPSELEEAGAGEGTLDEDAAAELLADICEERAIPCVLLHQPFRRHRDRGVARDELFIAGDGHWTARGHAVAAETIVPILTDLPAPARRPTGRDTGDPLREGS